MTTKRMTNRMANLMMSFSSRYRLARNRILSILTASFSFAAILLLSNCGAARPVRYFTLNPTPVPAPSIVIAGNAPLPVSIVVGRIRTSHLYLDDRIVYTTGGVELGTYEYNRWAAVPAEMIETMLVQTLRAQGKFRSVGRLGSSARGDYILRGHLYSLDEVDSPSLAARFSLELELFQPKTGMVVWSQSYTHEDAVNRKTVDAVVESLRQNVLAGLDQLTAGLDEYVSSHPLH